MQVILEGVFFIMEILIGSNLRRKLTTICLSLVLFCTLGSLASAQTSGESYAGISLTGGTAQVLWFDGAYSQLGSHFGVHDAAGNIGFRVDAATFLSGSGGGLQLDVLATGRQPTKDSLTTYYGGGISGIFFSDSLFGVTGLAGIDYGLESVGNGDMSIFGDLKVSVFLPEGIFVSFTGVQLGVRFKF